MARLLQCILLLLALAWHLPLRADTRVTLSKDAVALGEGVVLVIETDQPIASPDLGPLRNDFSVGAVRNARQINVDGGTIRATQRIEVELTPRRQGMLPIPPIVIGNQRTAPLLLEVHDAAQAPSMPARASTAATQANGPVFIDTVIDDPSPYVQQAVGVTVRLHYAINLYNGEFRQPEPSQGGSLQPIGNDTRSLRVVGGRQYQVLERHYLLVPERSGSLRLPGASFHGQAAGGLFDDLFGDGREGVSAEAPSRSLTVRPIPANAARPWLPARALSMRVAQPPGKAVAGEAFDVVVELRGEGLTAAQLPELELTADDAQVFAEPAQPTDSVVGGQPRVVMTRRFSIVPQHPGALTLRVEPVHWWDVDADTARSASVAPMQVTVAPGVGRYAQAPPDVRAISPSNDGVSERAAVPAWERWRHWLFAALAIAGACLMVWGLRRRRVLADGAATVYEPDAQHAPETARIEPRQDDIHAFRQAVASGDLAGIARRLPGLAPEPSADLAAAIEQLDDPAQRETASRLATVLWGRDNGNADALRQDVRRAFAKGPRWRRPATMRKPLLPPLYPER